MKQQDDMGAKFEVKVLLKICFSPKYLFNCFLEELNGGDIDYYNRIMSTPDIIDETKYSDEERRKWEFDFDMKEWYIDHYNAFYSKFERVQDCVDTDFIEYTSDIGLWADGGKDKLIDVLNSHLLINAEVEHDNDCIELMGCDSVSYTQNGGLEYVEILRVPIDSDITLSGHAPEMEFDGVDVEFDKGQATNTALTEVFRQYAITNPLKEEVSVSVENVIMPPTNKIENNLWFKDEDDDNPQWGHGRGYYDFI